VSGREESPVTNEKPTVKRLDQRMGGVEQQLGDLAESMADVQQSIRELGAGTTEQSERIWSAIGSIGGLDGIAGGLAEIAEVLTPLRQFTPPTTALPLDCGVPEALGTIRAALGGDDLDLNFTSLVTDWDGPVRFIGEAVCPPDYERAGEE
jgi:hypothetical protein